METKIINELWRKVYGKLQDGFKVLTPEWSKLQALKRFTPLSEREVSWPVKLRFGGGTALTGDGGSPARAMGNRPAEATEQWSWLARRYQLSLGLVKAQGNAQLRNAQIFDQMKFQGQDALESFRKSVSVLFYGFQDGIQALINSAAGAPTYTLKDRYGRTGLFVDTSVFTPGNDYVAVVDPAATTSERGRQKISSVNSATPSITLAASVSGAAANDYIVFANQLDTTAGVHDIDKSFPGLLEHIHATTLHGITEAAQPEWVPSLRRDKASAALTEAELFEVFTLAERRSPFSINYALSTPQVIAQAGGAQLDKIRYDADPGTIYLGFKNLVTMGVTVMIGTYTPKGYFIADSTDSLMKFSPDEEPFAVEEGGSDRHYYGTVLGYFVDLVYRVGLVRLSRASLVALYNVKDS